MCMVLDLSCEILQQKVLRQVLKYLSVYHQTLMLCVQDDLHAKFFPKVSFYFYYQTF